ncbi:hypothetical protein BDW71DRAFT_197400 [Aspergillus fruticulosus]
MQTCWKLSITTVAVYVDEDASSRHIMDADEANIIGNGPLRKRRCHPPRLRLSCENAEFARSIRDASMTSIGPSDTALSTLDDKRAAKDYLRRHAPDIPLIPGYAGSSQDAAKLGKVAAQIGFPMLKASAGGQLYTELERVQPEAQRWIGSADFILERYVESSKHVEIQILGDVHREVVSFFERDCSVQRRHQKVLEETPCAFLTDRTRQQMIEFVVDAVEHPITEEVTGVDLVPLQLYAAAGGSLRALPTLQGLSPEGHAIECHLCAEDPRKNFFPEHGKIYLSCVSIYFDSMSPKIVVWAPARVLAIEKTDQVLANTVCAAHHVIRHEEICAHVMAYHLHGNKGKSA